MARQLSVVDSYGAPYDLTAFFLVVRGANQIVYVLSPLASGSCSFLVLFARELQLPRLICRTILAILLFTCGKEERVW